MSALLKTREAILALILIVGVGIIGAYQPVFLEWRNIGDMLMRWSDDQLKSTLHRVRMPQPDEYQGSRYSMPFFCQANKDAIIQGPRKAYAPITAHDYLQQRIAANFAK